MPHNRTGESVQFSVKMQDSLLDRVGELAEERRWSRSSTVMYLLEEGDLADSEGEIGDDPEVEGREYVVSVYTTNASVVDRVQDLADEHFDGTFSEAARATIRNGLSESDSE